MKQLKFKFDKEVALTATEVFRGVQDGLIKKKEFFKWLKAFEFKAHSKAYDSGYGAGRTMQAEYSKQHSSGIPDNY